MPPETAPAASPVAPAQPAAGPPPEPDSTEGRTRLSDFRRTLRERDEAAVRRAVPENIELPTAGNEPEAADNADGEERPELDAALQAATDPNAEADAPETEGDPDQQQQQEDLLEAAIVGDLKGRDLLAALKSGVIDAKLFQQLSDKLGIEWEMDSPEGKRLIKMRLGELPMAALRQADYSRSKAELAEQRKAAVAKTRAAEQREASYKQLFDSWNDPQALYRDLRRMGKGKAVMAVATMIAERMHEANQLPEGAREVYLQNIELRERQEDIDHQRTRDQRRREAETQQQQQQRALAEDRAMLERLVPPAIERAGLKLDNRFVQDRLQAHLPRFARDGRITPAVVSEAVAAVKQEIEDFGIQNATRGAATAPANGNGARPTTPAPAARPAPGAPPLPPRRLTGGGPGAQKPLVAKGGTIRDFQRTFKRG